MLQIFWRRRHRKHRKENWEKMKLYPLFLVSPVFITFFGTFENYSYFSFILAYLMKYKQMSLREAFYYLRSRRPISWTKFWFY